MAIHYRWVFLVFASGLMTPTQSEAKILLITRGDTISDLGRIAGVHGNDLPAGARVGYKYSYIGVFWLDLWRYDGTFCIHDGNDRFDPISKTEGAQLLGTQESDLSEPFWYHFPPGLVIIGAIILIAVPAAYIGKAKQREMNSLMRDPRYQQALVLFVEKSQPPVPEDGEGKTPPAPEEGDAKPPAEGEYNPDLRSAGWTAAIEHLVSAGIEREQAEQNFQKLLDHLEKNSQE